MTTECSTSASTTAITYVSRLDRHDAGRRAGQKVDTDAAPLGADVIKRSGRSLARSLSLFSHVINVAAPVADPAAGAGRVTKFDVTHARPDAIWPREIIRQCVAV